MSLAEGGPFTGFLGHADSLIDWAMLWKYAIIYTVSMQTNDQHPLHIVTIGKKRLSCFAATRNVQCAKERDSSVWKDELIPQYTQECKIHFAVRSEWETTLFMTKEGTQCQIQHPDAKTVNF